MMDYQEEEDEAGAGFLGTIEQKEKEELEFYTDLAVQEMQRWIEVQSITYSLKVYALSLNSSKCSSSFTLLYAFRSILKYHSFLALSMKTDCVLHKALWLVCST